jgi:4-hydroxybenzoate polyprenyltransferase
VLAYLSSRSPEASARTAIAMLGLQLSIGALNDLIDAPRDAATKPGKPIPRAAVTTGEARAIAAGGFALALALTVPIGLTAAGILLLCAACGYAYDLRLSRTALSWLPLSIALPLVPAFAAASSTGSVPPSVLAVVLPGAIAGAGLSLANGLADLERDESEGRITAAVRLGPWLGWVFQAALVAVAILILVVESSVLDPTGLGRSGPGLAAGSLALAAGVLAGWGGGPARRERAWELEAVGVAVVAAAWFIGHAPPG